MYADAIDDVDSVDALHNVNTLDASFAPVAAITASIAETRISFHVFCLQQAVTGRLSLFLLLLLLLLLPSLSSLLWNVFCSSTR